MDGTESPGQLLRRTRREQGVTVKELSATTRIPPRLIQALEEDQYDEIPGEVFVRGFLRNCARELEVDPDLLVDHYRVFTGQIVKSRNKHSDEESEGLDTLFQAPRVPRLSFLIVVIAIVLGLALSIFIFGSPNEQMTGQTEPEVQETWHRD